MNTLHARSALHARVRPDHPAVRCEGRQFTYRQLHLESNRTAHALVAAGLRAGSRVAYLGRESEHYYGIVLACAKTGMVMVPINWRLTAAEIDHILRDSGAELLFVERDFLPAARRVLPAVPGLHTLVELDRPGEPFGGFLDWRGDAPEHDLDPGTDTDYPVVQLYTSGTTGLPKGVVLAHRTFFTLIDAMAEHGVDWLDWRPTDVSLIAFPGFYTAGMGWFMHGFNAGATNLIMRLFVSEEAVRLIEETGVTITFVAPAMLHMMLRERGVTSRTFRSLRKVAYGAAPIAEDLLRACIDVMGCEFAQIYASTETGSVAACLPPAAHVPGSPLLRAAGRACPGNELKIVDRDGEPVPPGEIGQVCVRTPSRMVGYWNQQEATSATLVDGWLLMGDAGYLDENGYLFLCDRINDTIIVAGQNIYPAEIEKVLVTHPAVAEVAVIGIPDERWGEQVQACVVLEPGAAVTGRELTLSLRDRIADFKIPTRYEFLPTLPRNPSGKVLRRELRERYRAATPVPAA